MLAKVGLKRPVEKQGREQSQRVEQGLQIKEDHINMPILTQVAEEGDILVEVLDHIQMETQWQEEAEGPDIFIVEFCVEALKEDRGKILH
jgi:hypothetical protein